MSNPQNPVACPYAERIAKVETIVETALPREFSEDWGTLKGQVKDMHETLTKNGLIRRVRLLEQRWAHLLGLAAGLSVAASIVTYVVALWLKS